MPSAASDLPDINVWVALSEAAHAHHSRASHYWNSERADRVVFCGTTILGMLRILTLPSAMGGNPFKTDEAFLKYREFARLPETGFIADSENICAPFGSWTSERFFTAKLWTDAWIAAVAMENGCRVVSFDADFARFPGLNFLHLKP